MSRLAAWSLHEYVVTHDRRIRWSDCEEETARYVLLAVRDRDGYRGVAEATLKPSWTGTDGQGLSEALSERLIPAAQEGELDDLPALSARLDRHEGLRAAKALLETACLTLWAQRRGLPLWQLWGGQPSIPVAWTALRQVPERMAEEAAMRVARHGFRALKVKGGQGFETDRAAVRLIRAAVGEGVDIHVDANDAYAQEDAGRYVRMLADEGVDMVEDPCRLSPEFLSQLQADSPVPILVDAGCVSAQAAADYLDAGAQALSIKPARVGLYRAREMTALAERRRAAYTIGMFAETSLGCLISAQLASCARNHGTRARHELAFYLQTDTRLSGASLEVVDGQLQLPSRPIADCVDWNQVLSGPSWGHPDAT